MIRARTSDTGGDIFPNAPAYSQSVRRGSVKQVYAESAPVNMREERDEEEPRTERKVVHRNAVMLFLILLVIGLAGLSFYFYKNGYKLSHAQGSNVQDDTAQVVASVSRLMVLPEAEQPTVATVTDLSTLKNQAFFAHAQVGDKVLIYTASKKAILYSPKQNKIIEVAPVNNTAEKAQ